MQWGGHNYFLSWREPWHKFEDWDWFNGRNFCRDRCMDLVSFDTQGEHDLFAALVRQGQLKSNYPYSIKHESLQIFKDEDDMTIFLSFQITSAPFGPRVVNATSKAKAAMLSTCNPLISMVGFGLGLETPAFQRQTSGTEASHTGAQLESKFVQTNMLNMQKKPHTRFLSRCPFFSKENSTFFRSLSENVPDRKL